MHQPNSIRNVLLRGAAAMPLILLAALPLAAQPRIASKAHPAPMQSRRAVHKHTSPSLRLATLHTTSHSRFCANPPSFFGPPVNRIPNKKGGFVAAQRNYFLTPRTFPGGQWDVDAYRRATLQRKRLPGAVIAGRKGLGVQAPGALANWEFVGPAGYSFGAYQSNTGRINGITYDPSNTNTLYVASAKGGIWQSQDGGGSWAPLTDFQPGLATSCIAVDQTDSNTIYAGTGDFEGFYYRDGDPGFGILKSTDGGLTWSVKGATTFGTAPIHRITIDPQTPSKLFAAAGAAGLFLSTDSGETWQLVLGPTATGSAPAVTGNVSNIVYNWTGTIIYAAIDNAGIYQSLDGGLTWTTVPGAPSGTGRFDVAPSAIQDAFGERTLYVINGGAKNIQVGAPGGMPRNPHNALEWKTRGNFPDVKTIGYDPWAWVPYTLSIACTHQVINYNGDPTKKPPIPPTSVDTDVLYVGLADLWQSQDAGFLWQYASTEEFPVSYGHAFFHAITLNPNDSTHVWTGNDGGAFDLSYVQTVNDPVPPVTDPMTPPVPLGPWGTFTLTPLNSGLGVVQFYSGAYHPTSGDILLGGTTENGALYTTSGVNGWTVADGSYDADAGAVGIDQLDGNIQYATGHSGHQSDPIIGLPIYVGAETTDNWASDAGLSLYYGDDTEPFLLTGRVNTADPTQFYVGTNYLYDHVEGSSQPWTKFRQRFSNKGYILAIANAPTNANYLYVGTSDGFLWFSKDGGATFARIDRQGVSGGLPVRSITGIAVSPLNPLKVFATVSGTRVSHVWRCDNVTKPTWVSIGGEAGNAPFPDIFTNCLCIMPRNADKEMFVGTDLGVFYTTDGGLNWTDATQSLQLPTADVRDLTYMPQTGYLMAATYGRGFWRLGIPIPVSVGSLLITPNPVVGGYVASGTVTINGVAPAGGLKVTLSSSNSAVASLPSHVTIPAGQTHADFTVITHYVANDTTVKLTASANNSSISTPLLVQHPVLASLTLTPNDVVGSSNSVGVVTLSGPTPNGVTVQLSSTYPTVAGLPSSVKVPANRIIARFLVTTREVSQDTQVTVTASANGVNLSQKLLVESPKLVSLSLAPSTVQSGGISIATVRLSAPALRGGAYVILTGGSGIVTIPARVVIPEGQTAVQFRVHAGVVTTSTNTTLTATYNGGSVSGTLTVTP